MGETYQGLGLQPKKTTPYHPPANITVGHFNLMAYAAKLDPVEEVNKLVASYRNTPHSVIGQKPSKLMFNRLSSTSKGKHHKEARRNDREAKRKMKERYDRKHQTRVVKFSPGDWATSSTRGPWEPTPFQIIKVVHNRARGKKEQRTRDRSGWKLLVQRPRKPATTPRDQQSAGTPAQPPFWITPGKMTTTTTGHVRAPNRPRGISSFRNRSEISKLQKSYSEKCLRRRFFL